MKKSCTALKVHLYWPISTQISAASCGKNRNFRDSQQIAWLKKSSQVERLCSAKSKAVKRRASHLIWPVKARGIYIALFPCHGVLLFSCVFFFHHAARENKKEIKTQRPDRSLGGGFKDSLFYPLQECALVHPCNFRLVINLRAICHKNGICSGILRKRLTNLSGKAARTQLRWKKGELEIGG